MQDKNHLLMSYFSIINTYLQSCIGAKSCQYTGTNLQKATPFSHSLASIGIELQSPQLLYSLIHLLVHMQRPTEGSNLHSFSSCYQKGAPTPWLLYYPIHLLVRRHQPTKGSNLHSFSSFYWKRAPTPGSCTSCYAYQYEGTSLKKATTFSLPLRTTFHKIFRLDTLGTQHHNLKASFHQIFILDPLVTLKIKINHI